MFCFIKYTRAKIQKRFIYRITDLDPSLFAELSDLEILILDKNMIRSMPSMPYLPKLTKLSMAENKLETIGTALDGLTNLTSLDLHENKLQSVDLSKLEKLQEISLSNNMLKMIPKFQSNALQSIDLGENNIEEIPQGIFTAQLETLYALRLSGNDITAVSNTTFGNMTNLHMLNLAHNRLEVIPQVNICYCI